MCPEPPLIRVNLGVWLFHCHIDWHLVSGLVATMIEDPIAMQKNLTIPQNHYGSFNRYEPTARPHKLT